MFAQNEVMKLGSMKISVQENEFHAISRSNKKEDRISHATMLANGKDMFSNLLEQDPHKPEQRHLKKLLLPSSGSTIPSTHIKQSGGSSNRVSLNTLMSSFTRTGSSGQHMLGWGLNQWSTCQNHG